MREPVRDKGRLENILEACQLLVSKKNEDTLETIKADIPELIPVIERLILDY